MAGGRKGRTKAWKEEGSDPRSERKGAEKSNIDPKICRKRVPESTKIVPKSTQKGPKTKIRQTKNQSNLVKMILDPPGGRFPGYRARARCHLGCQNRAKLVKNWCNKSLIFWSVLEAKKVRKRSPKPLQNGVQDGPKSSPQGKTRRKWEKCKNEQHSMVLAWFLPSRGGRKLKKKSTKIGSKIKSKCGAISNTTF